ncbi:cdk7 [Symbiodinium sp. CCMP2592]|nr:cdk7 [Symbiodinium sp. CCMP2592]
MDADLPNAKRPREIAKPGAPGPRKGNHQGGKGRGRGHRQWGRGGGQGPKISDGTSLEELVRLMAQVLLRQGDQLQRLSLDTGFFLILQTPPQPGSITNTMFRVTSAWKKLMKETPEKLDRPLRQHMIECLFLELAARAQLVRKPEAKAEAQQLGIINDKGDWNYRIWNATSQKLEVDQKRMPLKADTFLEQIDKATAIVRRPDVITRFQAIALLSETTENASIPFLLDLSLREQELHNIMLDWCELAVFELLAGRLRRARLKRNQCYANAVILALSRLLQPICYAGHRFACTHLGQVLRSVQTAKVSKALTLRNLTAWSSLADQWSEPYRQHDAAEFLQHVLSSVDSVLALSPWEAFPDGDDGSLTRDRGSGVVLIPMRRPDQQLHPDIQASVDDWHQQRHLHAFRSDAEWVVLQLDRFKGRGVFQVRDNAALPIPGRLCLPVCTSRHAVHHQIYHTTAVVLHYGAQVSSGHYRVLLMGQGSGNAGASAVHYITDDDRQAVRCGTSELENLASRSYLLFMQRATQPVLSGDALHA